MLVVKTFKGQSHTFDLPKELADKLVQKDRRYKYLNMNEADDESEKIEITEQVRRPRTKRR